MAKQHPNEQMDSEEEAIYNYLNTIASQPLSNEQKVFFYNERERLYTEHKREDLKAAKDYNQARVKYAHYTFCLVCTWLGCMLVIVFLQGLQSMSLYLPLRNAPKLLIGFHLSDNVLITLITTTTINVIAYFTIVLNNLFPADPGRTLFGKSRKQK